MFATAQNKVAPFFVSRHPDEKASVIDALLISCDNLGLVYAFPPVHIVPKTLENPGHTDSF